MTEREINPANMGVVGVAAHLGRKRIETLAMSFRLRACRNCCPTYRQHITTPAALRKELKRICAVPLGVSEQTVAVSVPVRTQRFYRPESELAHALLAWVLKGECLV
jgi:hypothetical protein